jgi:asparagine synthetase B (glutamine-hydrolysing)
MIVSTSGSRVATAGAPACLRGAVSLDGTLLGEPEGGVLHDARGVRLAVNGRSPELHALHDRDGAFVVFGRVYEPVRLDPWTGAPAAALRALAHADWRAVQGGFVAVRAREGVLELVTDKYGLRPVFYRRAGGVLRFATHLSGLGPLPGIDEEALLHYYNFAVTPNDRTLLAGVRKVPPGSILAVRDGAVTVEPYFALASLFRPDAYRGRGEEDLCEAIDAALQRSVARRLPEGGPVGVALSGGVDSGYLAAAIRRAGATPVGFTLAYGDTYDEFGRVGHLAARLGMDVRKLRLEPGAIRANFEQANRDASEPVPFNNATLRFVGAAARADGVRALFDGDGADRLFLGMSRYLKYRGALRVYGLLRRTGALPLARLALRFLPGEEWRKLRLHVESWRRGIPAYGERDLGATLAYDAGYERRVYETAVARHRGAFERGFGDADFGAFFTYLAVQMCPEMFFHDPAELQAVFPVPAFWDDDLVSLALSLPTGWKLRGKTTKYVLRKAAARHVDPGYWMLPKIGLQPSAWFATGDPDGKRWHRGILERTKASPEAETLRGLVPGGLLDADKLIALTAWKEGHGIR